MASQVWLIVGLGNPGAKYAKTRHNAGFMAAEAWAARHRIAIEKKKSAYLYGEGKFDLTPSPFPLREGEVRVIVAKPRTYMNLSGDAVGELAQRHHIAKERLIIVYDDLDLPLGRIRIRAAGSAGGHNGMKSIIERLGTQEFARMRIGVGRPEAAGKEAVDYVLEGFTKAEQAALDATIARACDALDEIIAKGIAGAMNKFNG
ncbi:MAG: aminoacyl-tRNA hydrolase [Chloroflexi bacterium]|nr:aminoacyl-tRNA hydrolase [Chloroflexota bacterium]